MAPYFSLTPSNIGILNFLVAYNNEIFLLQNCSMNKRLR